MIVKDWDCAAAIDWETITLAGPQLDLAHWLLMEDYYTECLGLAPLPGFGTREETIAFWEERMGRRADALDWHEVLATYRIVINMVRYVKLWAPAGRTNITDSEGETPISRRLRKVLKRVAGIEVAEPTFA
jgi:aminoglycoside phosphotransferase (APT) family kinase protein